MAVIEYIYVIECAGFHKVGKTWDIKSRLDSFIMGNPLPMTAVHLAAVDKHMARRIELRAHRALHR